MKKIYFLIPSAIIMFLFFTLTSYGNNIESKNNQEYEFNEIIQLMKTQKYDTALNKWVSYSDNYSNSYEWYLLTKELYAVSYKQFGTKQFFINRNKLFKSINDYEFPLNLKFDGQLSNHQTNS